MSHWVLESLRRVWGRPPSLIERNEESDVVETFYRPVDSNLDAVQEAAKLVLEGRASSVLLLPTSGNSFCAMPTTVLPPDCLVFPGSFHPPHVGHVTLAQAALAAWKRQTASPSEEESVFFELSLVNADKPSLDPATVSERAHLFLSQHNLPKHWGLLLTRAPLFLEKVDILSRSLVVPSFREHRMAWIIGTDTLLRILDAKYYQDSPEKMHEALQGMKRQGAHFVVGGRLPQKGDSQTFVTGEPEVKALPLQLQDMFTLLKEQDFRQDISSTELRTKLSQGKSTE